MNRLVEGLGIELDPAYVRGAAQRLAEGGVSAVARDDPRMSEPDAIVMSGWLDRCRRCFTAGVLKRSLRVALIVGTTPNVINQGDALFGSRKLNLLKLLLTYGARQAARTTAASPLFLGIKTEAE